MQKSSEFLNTFGASQGLKIAGALTDFSFVVVKEVFHIVGGKF